MILVKILMNNFVCGVLLIEGFVDLFYVFEEFLLNRNLYKLEFLMLNILFMFNNVYLVVEDVKIW